MKFAKRAHSSFLVLPLSLGFAGVLNGPAEAQLPTQLERAPSGPADAGAEEPRRAYLGISVQSSAEGGARVGAVEPGTPAARADLRVGDRILSVDGERMQEPGDVVRTLGAMAPGRAVRLRIGRAERDLDVEVVLGSWPSAQLAAPAADSDLDLLQGLLAEESADRAAWAAQLADQQRKLQERSEARWRAFWSRSGGPDRAGAGPELDELRERLREGRDQRRAHVQEFLERGREFEAHRRMELESWLEHRRQALREREREARAPEPPAQPVAPVEPLAPAPPHPPRSSDSLRPEAPGFARPEARPEDAARAEELRRLRQDLVDLRQELRALREELHRD